MYDRLKGSSKNEGGAPPSNGPATEPVKAEETNADQKKVQAVKAEQVSA